MPATMPLMLAGTRGAAWTWLAETRGEVVGANAGGLGSELCRLAG